MLSHSSVMFRYNHRWQPATSPPKIFSRSRRSRSRGTRPTWPPASTSSSTPSRSSTLWSSSTASSWPSSNYSRGWSSPQPSLPSLPPDTTDNSREVFIQTPTETVHSYHRIRRESTITANQQQWDWTLKMQILQKLLSHRSRQMVIIIQLLFCGKNQI